MLSSSTSQSHYNLRRMSNQPKRKSSSWKKRRTTLKVRNLDSNHRACDTLALHGKDVTLSARFVYGYEMFYLLLFNECLQTSRYCYSQRWNSGTFTTLRVQWRRRMENCRATGNRLLGPMLFSARFWHNFAMWNLQSPVYSFGWWLAGKPKWLWSWVKMSI